ncbi:MAG TPA: hypothetical protein ENJ37_05640 [Deltaproteobacteria bacterium]|nr:hypothetical protein [Deltaproteobacteria bacterium]
MGAYTYDEHGAIEKFSAVPRECRFYISHAVRNGLTRILVSLSSASDRRLVRELEAHVYRIAADLEKAGL